MVVLLINFDDLPIAILPLPDIKVGSADFDSLPQLRRAARTAQGEGGPLGRFGLNKVERDDHEGVAALEAGGGGLEGEVGVGGGRDAVRRGGELDGTRLQG